MSWGRSDDESYGRVRGLEVVHELDFVRFADGFDGLELEDHPAIDDDVGEEGPDDGSVIEDVDGRFDDERPCRLMKFYRHGFLVDGFQEARTEGVVYLERAVDDFFRERIVDHAFIARESGLLD